MCLEDLGARSIPKKLDRVEKLTVEAYLRQRIYLGVSISVALVAIGLASPAQAYADMAMDTLKRVVPVSVVAEI